MRKPFLYSMFLLVFLFSLVSAKSHGFYLNFQLSPYYPTLKNTFMSSEHNHICLKKADISWGIYNYNKNFEGVGFGGTSSWNNNYFECYYLFYEKGQTYSYKKLSFQWISRAGVSYIVGDKKCSSYSDILASVRYWNVGLSAGMLILVFTKDTYFRNYSMFYFSIIGEIPIKL